MLEILSGIKDDLLHRFRADSPHFEVTEHPDRYIIQGDVPDVLREHLTLHALNQHTLSVGDSAKTTQKTRNEETTISTSSQGKNLIDTEPSLAEQCMNDPFDVDKTDAKKENNEIEGTGNLDSLEINSVNPSYRGTRHGDANDLTASRSIPITRQDSLNSHHHQFHRTFHFADPIDIEKTKASLNLGTLHIEAPKAVANAERSH